MLGYFCPNLLICMPEQWYPAMRVIQSWELGGNGSRYGLLYRKEFEQKVKKIKIKKTFKNIR